MPMVHRSNCLRAPKDRPYAPTNGSCKETQNASSTAVLDRCPAVKAARRAQIRPDSDAIRTGRSCLPPASLGPKAQRVWTLRSAGSFHGCSQQSPSARLAFRERLRLPSGSFPGPHRDCDQKTATGSFELGRLLPASDSQTWIWSSIRRQSLLANGRETLSPGWRVRRCDCHAVPQDHRSAVLSHWQNCRQDILAQV